MSSLVFGINPSITLAEHLLPSYTNDCMNKKNNELGWKQRAVNIGTYTFIGALFAAPPVIASKTESIPPPTLEVGSFGPCIDTLSEADGLGARLECANGDPVASAVVGLGAPTILLGVAKSAQVIIRRRREAPSVAVQTAPSMQSEA